MKNIQLYVTIKRMPSFAGKRKCLGESVAKTTLLLFLANFLANFKFEKCAEDYDPEASAGGLTVGPPKFFANVVPVKLD